MEHQSADHQSHHGIRRNAEREHRNEARLCAGIVCRFGAGYAADVALSKGRIGLFAGKLLFKGVGRKRREQCAAARENAKE